jgi:hypothetical protein
VNQQGHTSSAAQLCLDWTNPPAGSGTYSDWFLPTTGQFRHLVNNIAQVQKTFETDSNPLTHPLSNGYYWTSKEADADSARVCGFVFEPNDCNDFSKNELLFVRCMREF